jgi:hypothetical protein
MRVVLAIAGVVGLLLAAGCGDSGGRTVTAEPVSAPSTMSARPSSPTSTQGPGKSPSSQPAPARLTVAQARKRYLAVTRPYNVALERFETAANSGASVQTLRARARSVAAANLAESRLLLSIAWPTTVTGQIQELARADASARRHWLRVAAADSLAEMAGGKGPAAEIRRRLGLPKYNESDYS